MGTHVPTISSKLSTVPVSFYTLSSIPLLPTDFKASNNVTFDPWLTVDSVIFRNRFPNHPLVANYSSIVLQFKLHRRGEFFYGRLINDSQNRFFGFFLRITEKRIYSSYSEKERRNSLQFFSFRFLLFLLFFASIFCYSHGDLAVRGRGISLRHLTFLPKGRAKPVLNMYF